MRDIKRRGDYFSYYAIPFVVEKEDVSPLQLSWQWPMSREHPPVVTSVTVSCESPEAVLLNESLTSLSVCGVNLDNINPIFNDGIDTN